MFFGFLIIFGQFFCGVCYYLNAFCQDFILTIQNIDKLCNDYAQKATEEKNNRIAFEQALNKELCVAINFQADIIE